MDKRFKANFDIKKIGELESELWSLTKIAKTVYGRSKGALSLWIKRNGFKRKVRVWYEKN